MATIYVIRGGGQRIRQNILVGNDTYYEKVENSDWPKQARCEGQDNFTTDLWCTDLETVKKWANDWAGEEIQLGQAKEEETF